MRVCRGWPPLRAASHSLATRAGWRVRDPSWVKDVEGSSSINGSASYFELEWRGRIYAEGELASNIICCSAGAFDAEWALSGEDKTGSVTSLATTAFSAWLTA